MDSSGGDSGAGTDATDAAVTMDTPPDSFVPPPDGFPAGQVRITVATTSTPTPDIPIVIRDAAQMAIEVVNTDANGRVVTTIPSGGSISAVMVFSDKDVSISHILAIEPGDDITIGFPVPASANVDLEVPTGAGRLSASSKCGNGGNNGTATLTVRNVLGCTNGDLFVSGHNHLDNFVDTGSFLVPALDMPPNGLVDLSAQTFKQATPFTHQLQGITSELRSASAVVYATTPTLGFFVSVASGSAAQYPQPLPATPTQQATTGVPAFTASELVVATGLSAVFDPGFLTGVNVFERVAPGTSYSLDLATVATRRVSSGPSITGGLVSWTESGEGAADHVRIFWTYGFSNPQGNFQYRHDVIAPHVGTSVQTPLLPPPFDIYNQPAELTLAGGSIILTKEPGGYAAARNRPPETHFSPGLSFDELPVGQRKIITSVAGQGRF